MRRSSAKIVREYGPFPGVDRVHGVTYDGQHVWFASGDKLNAFDPASLPLVPGAPRLGRGKILVTAQVVRDIFVSGLYVIFGLGQIFFWKFWQERGKRAAAVPAIETSAYGRPLVRRT